MAQLPVWELLGAAGVPGTILCLLLLQTCAGDDASVSTGLPTAIHPKVRRTAGPAGGQAVSVNPPPMLWPSAGGKATYSVRLSQQDTFPPDSTISAEGLRWAMFNAHRKLAPGTWYWQYGVSIKGGATKWSETMSFQITDAAREFVTPPGAEMLAAVPRSHPRLVVTAEELPELRRRARESREAQSVVERAKRSIGKKLRDEASGRSKQKGASNSQEKKFARWASKGLAGKTAGLTDLQAQAYLLSGDEACGREAIRCALHVASWDPDGVTSWGVSDFADGSCLRAMAVTYDACYDLLTEEQRTVLRDAIRTRAGRMFGKWRSNVETKIFSAHIWQHILHDFAQAAFATLHDVPEASEWATYVYELWIARVPLQGGSDGGWANGNNYFRTNFRTLVAIPKFFERLTGVGFFNHPWYQNVAQFLVYTWPPHSHSDGFGDGCDRREKLAFGRIAFADVLAREMGSPLASWYVKASLDGTGKTLARDSLFRMYRLTTSKSPPPVPEGLPASLPQARAFRDIGVVAMHTDLAHAPRNIMAAFRSSPYGSFNHAHADQNCFHLFVAGDRLFHSTGYYIAYGDDHFKGWYKHSRGHNTVLIDGKGQTFGPEGYGWIARYLHGDRITYCLGDASMAYGDAGLTRFRRHMVLLRPNTVVVYDDLEADHPADWSWLLHSHEEMKREAGRQRLSVAMESGRGSVDIIAGTPLRIEVDHRFDPPALNWRKITERDGSVKVYPDQWHAVAKPAEKAVRMRCLAVFQIRHGDDKAPFADVAADAEGWVTMGDWRIRAECDASKPAALEIRSVDGSAALTAGKARVTVGGTSHDAPGAASTILVETVQGNPNVQIARDELPQGAQGHVKR